MKVKVPISIGKADNFIGMLHDTQYGSQRTAIPDLEAMKHNFGNYIPAIDMSRIKASHKFLSC
mgnify:FL=1